MSEVLVRVEGLSKKFPKTLRHSMLYGIIDIAKGLVGSVGISSDLRAQEFWALDDISFELKRGECLGLIGANGAGKTTLLKLLTGVIQPDKGHIEMHGRVGALIELGAGFHPLLTGRENIYINGSILGLKKDEVDSRMDAIIEFAGLRDFIDVPVKYYSSGMYVRLGFAIAAQVDPDILLIDEVLAVGDVSFRARCYNYVASVNRKAAVIFVSHSMGSIARICSHVAVVDKGKQVYFGLPPGGIEKYYSLAEDVLPVSVVAGSGRAKIFALTFLDSGGAVTDEIMYNSKFAVEIDAEIDMSLKHPIVFVGFYDRELQCVAECSSRNSGCVIRNTGKRVRIRVEVPNCILNPGVYKVSCCIYCEKMQEHCAWHFAAWQIKVKGDFIGMNSVQFKGRWETMSEVSGQISGNSLRE